MSPRSPTSTSAPEPPPTYFPPRRPVSLSSSTPITIQRTLPTSSDRQETMTVRDNYNRPNSSQSDHPIVKVTSTDVHTTSSSLPASNYFDDNLISTFRDRSRSSGRSPTREKGPETSDHPLSTSWWGEKKHSEPKKKRVHPEQTEAMRSTQKKIAQAIASALGTAADITHEALFVGVDLLGLAPIPGLQPVGQLLLNIWDASQLVDMNVLSCLRLAERCADILISVRQEIFDAGDVVGQELAAPIQKLEESFEGVHRFLIKQINRPFLKRYLRRDQILRDISDCDGSLRDALGLFGISIQIRILKQVQEAEKHRQAETKALIEAIMSGRIPLSGPDPNAKYEQIRTPISNNYQLETVAGFTTTGNALGLFENTPHPSSIAPQDLSPSQIIPALTSLHSIQNYLDTAMDTVQLRQLIQAALQTTRDVDMLEVLQIGHQEMPEAIKTLQRALENITEGDDDGVEPPPGLVVVEEPGGSTLKRSTTIISVNSSRSSTSSSGHSSRDTLDREFIESGIDALRRMSRGGVTSLPSWTITKYEVDRDEKIGIGFFSDVYKGTWRGRTVAIKVLAESTPRKLFVREIEIWKTLRHHNVLPLCGASGASGDPPWFFVSPYMKNGSLVQYLKLVELEERPSNLGIGMGFSQMPLSTIRTPESNLGFGTFPAPWTAVRGVSPTRRDLTPPNSRGRPLTPEDTAIHREWNLFRFMHEIAKGMEYLHSRGVLHGDLKGANVLVDDKYRCVISDFGQSEMKSEAYRISGTLVPHGTLRWQSPELMQGQSQLTQEIDVWAFSMCCVEILTLGRIPWPLHNDDSVRHFVLTDDSRPPLPESSRFNTPGLQDILRACWATKPLRRPTFSKVVKDFKQLRKSCGQEVVDSPWIPVIDEISETTTACPSPDMRPCLTEYLQGPDDLSDDLLPELDNMQKNFGSFSSSDLPQPESTVSTEDKKTPEPVIYEPVTSRHSSFVIPATQSEEHLNVIDYDGYNSPPPPINEEIANTRNERRYRFLLTHEYHPSLTLPLWDPSPVEVGAVGYLFKPRGHFVTLFNALTPSNAKHPGIQSLPSIHGYGATQVETHRQDRRTVTQKGMDAFAGLLTFRTFSEKVSRRYSYPLKAGHKMALLCTETTDYRYLDKLDAPKRWFQTNVDVIMQIYGNLHHLQKEDLFLVIGTLSAPNHALFVSHRHPEGHVHFSVYATPKVGKPWGTFTTDTKVAPELGPSYDDEAGDNGSPVQESKISCYGGGPWDTVLVARLRFKPDILEPTSK